MMVQCTLYSNLVGRYKVRSVVQLVTVRVIIPDEYHTVE